MSGQFKSLTGKRSLLPIALFLSLFFLETRAPDHFQFVFSLESECFPSIPDPNLYDVFFTKVGIPLLYGIFATKRYTRLCLGPFLNVQPWSQPHNPLTLFNLKTERLEISPIGLTWGFKNRFFSRGI